MRTELRPFALSLLLLGLPGVAGCAATLSQREQGGLIGMVAGAGTGAIIGSVGGHAAAGAAIGGPVGLIGGALVGDYLMRQDQTQRDQQHQMEQNQTELKRLRKENEQLRRKVESR